VKASCSYSQECWLLYVVLILKPIDDCQSAFRPPLDLRQSTANGSRLTRLMPLQCKNSVAKPAKKETSSSWSRPRSIANHHIVYGAARSESPKRLADDLQLRGILAFRYDYPRTRCPHAIARVTRFLEKTPEAIIGVMNERVSGTHTGIWTLKTRQRVRNPATRTLRVHMVRTRPFLPRGKLSEHQCQTGTPSIALWRWGSGIRRRWILRGVHPARIGVYGAEVEKVQRFWQIGLVYTE
jgi:hypothetical protein